ncbi:MAG: Hsp70 family protein [Planctomycetes bacterium]|nr:Hsp70 family protein [Planctomycetota bacterium]
MSSTNGREAIIGIDLGTTNSEVAVVEDCQPRIITDGGDGILPSAVGLDMDGRLLVGEPALNQMLAAPERTVRSIKRRMGTADKVRLGDVEYTPQEISAVILRHLKERAERYLGAPVRKAVITVPAYFNDAQRQATREAGELAGLEVVRILHEPTAASLVYEAERCRGEAAIGPRKILVYDMGGGTFDVSIVEIHSGVIEVRASHGDTHLGGDDFDALLLDHVAERFLKERGVDLRSIPRARARTLRAVERAKRVLSSHPFVTVEEEFIAERDGVPLHLSVELRRDDYEAMIRPLIERSMGSVQTALHDAKLLTRDIDRIVLVGGATRTPLIQRELAARTGIEPHHEVDPDLCVALGAAAEAALIAGEDLHSVLVDITPHSMGVGCLDELDEELGPYLFSPVIPKGSTLPAARSEVYYTASDYQKVVEVCVYQGEERDVRRNTKLGTFRVEGLTPVPAGNEIVIQFQLTLDGTLTAKATEKATGLSRQIVVDDALHSFTDEDRARARERLDRLHRLEVDGGSPAAAGAEGGATGEVASAEPAAQPAGKSPQDQAIEDTVRRIRALLDRMVPEDREEAVELIDRATSGAAAGRLEDARAAHRELQEMLFFLEEA